MKVTPEHFSDLIASELQNRQAKNLSYSIRAFARDLGLSPSTLSNILLKKSGLSESKAEEVATKLQLKGEDKEFFLILVQANCSRMKSERQLAKARLFRFETKYNTLSTDLFQVIADWYHLAIMELTLIKGFKSDPAWIAAKLQITEEEAYNGLERLIRLNILAIEDSKLKPTNDYLIVLSQSPSESVRHFQNQIIDKLRHSITHHDRSTRDMSSVVLRMRSDEMDEIKKRLKEFRRDFTASVQEGEGHDSVYCLTTAFFQLDQ